MLESVQTTVAPVELERFKPTRMNRGQASMAQRWNFRVVGVARVATYLTACLTVISAAHAEDPQFRSESPLQLQRRVNASLGLLKSDVSVLQIRRADRGADAPAADDAI
ncbi:MAG: hypothetical protein CUN53_21545, partial [Phototrophicales bacterium]